MSKFKSARHLLLAGMLLTGLATALPAAAVTVGDDEGCTPGYWKNHTSAWEEYSPSQTISSVFTNAAPYGDLTLLQGLSLSGGPGVDGAKQILIRAAIAAVLNAAHDSLGYPWRRSFASEFGRPALIPTVNNALASGSRSTILDLATRLDRDNNLGCPLN